ncbi:MAG: 4-hydroxy-3-methylbut-2-enyl diphosphate reductase [Candidatus Bipolaricaulota bacterium]
MSEITKAKVLGFCGGVRRAVQMIEGELAARGPLHTLGAIVHNAHVVAELAAKGARMARSLDDVPAGGTAAITAHGAGEEVVEEILRRGLRLVDTTCPIVRRAQRTAAQLAEEGFGVVLYGEAEHPEVRGILSWTRGRGLATQSPDVEPPPGPRGIAVISQTTKSPEKFAEFAKGLVGRLAGRVPEIRVVDTTCPETGRRYQAAEDLATCVDALVVVGSRSSANTRKLAETCEATGRATYLIESADEIEDDWGLGRLRVGVTAGASTPDAVVDEVVDRLAHLGDATRTGDPQ